VVSGPSLLVDHILKLSGAQKLTELVQDVWKDDTSAFLSTQGNPTHAKLYMRRRDEQASPPPQVYSSPRIGLDLSHPGTAPSRDHPRVQFVRRAYRFFVHPELLVKNGRAQTFLGIFIAMKRTLGDSAKENVILDATAKAMGSGVEVVRKYLVEYQAGRSKGDIAAFVGVKGKGVGASAPKYLRMQGILAQDDTT
jgi:hypothetical protein